MVFTQRNLFDACRRSDITLHAQQRWNLCEYAIANFDIRPIWPFAKKRNSNKNHKIMMTFCSCKKASILNTNETRMPCAEMKTNIRIETCVENFSDGDIELACFSKSYLIWKLNWSCQKQYKKHFLLHLFGKVIQITLHDKLLKVICLHSRVSNNATRKNVHCFDYQTNWNSPNSISISFEESCLTDVIVTL